MGFPPALITTAQKFKQELFDGNSGEHFAASPNVLLQTFAELKPARSESHDVVNRLKQLHSSTLPPHVLRSIVRDLSRKVGNLFGKEINNGEGFSSRVREITKEARAEASSADAPHEGREALPFLSPMKPHTSDSRSHFDKLKPRLGLSSVASLLETVRKGAESTSQDSCKRQRVLSFPESSEEG